MDSERLHPGGSGVAGVDVNAASCPSGEPETLPAAERPCRG
jgi:hypothetical protein